MPRQTFQHATPTPASIGSVWIALDEPGTWESIPGVDRVTDPIIDPSGRLQGFSFESVVAGKTYPGRAIPAGREDHKLVAWDIKTPEIRGTVTVGLSPDGAGTRVYVKLDIDPAGTLGSLFFPVIASAIGSEFAGTVEDFVKGLAPA